MADADLKIEGLRELNRALRTLPGVTANRVVPSAGRRSGNIFRKSWREAIDRAGLVDTGAARKAIKVRTRQKGGTETIVTVHSGNAFYLMFHEFGTRFLAPNPTARTAYKNEKDHVVKAAGEFIFDGVEKETRRLNPRGRR